VELVAGDVDRGELLVGDFDAFGVVAVVELGVDLQSLGGRVGTTV